VLRYTLSKALIVDLNSEGRKRPFKCAHCEKPLLPFLHPTNHIFPLQIASTPLATEKMLRILQSDRSQEKE
jgi:hypothetical protein